MTPTWPESWADPEKGRPPRHRDGPRAARTAACGAFGIGGEVLLDLTRRWSIGIGSGYALSEVSEGATTLEIERSSVPYVYARPTRVAATPLFLSGYHTFPLGSRLGLYIGAGAGQVRVRYSSSAAAKKAASSGFAYSDEQSASGRGKLVQGTAGFKYVHDQNIGLFLEAVWRRAKVETLEDGTGTLYAYDEYRADIDFWQAKMAVLDGPPAGETFRSVRKVGRAASSWRFPSQVLDRKEAAVSKDSFSARGKTGRHVLLSEGQLPGLLAAVRAGSTPGSRSS
jgi:opacity protein-like surface antigen